MKKKLRIKVSDTASLIKLMRALGEISADIDAEGSGNSVDICIYGDEEEIKSAVRKIRQIAREL